MKTSIVVVVLLLSATVAGFYWLPQGDLVISQSDPLSSQPDDYREPIAATPMHARINQSATFRGASPDGRLQVLNGALLVNRDLKRWMDFYLSSVGEFSIEEITEFMEAEMRTLPAPADQQALDLLYKYLAYLDDISRYDEVSGRKINGADLAGLTARMEWLEDLRRVYFADATIAAFFGDDEALDRYSLERIRLAQSGDTEAMQQLEKELPLHLRVAREKARAIETSQSLRDSIDDPEALWQARKEQFGEAAADRLAALDVERQQWHARLSDYHDFLERNSAKQNFDELAEAYRAENFSVVEQKRIDAALQARSAQIPESSAISPLPHEEELAAD